MKEDQFDNPLFLLSKFGKFWYLFQKQNYLARTEKAIDNIPAIFNSEIEESPWISVTKKHVNFHVVSNSFGFQFEGIKNGTVRRA